MHTVRTVLLLIDEMCYIRTVQVRTMLGVCRLPARVLHTCTLTVRTLALQCTSIVWLTCTVYIVLVYLSWYLVVESL